VKKSFGSIRNIFGPRSQISISSRWSPTMARCNTSGTSRAQVPGFFRWHPYRFRGARKSQDRGSVKAQVDRLQHLSTLYPNEASWRSRRRWRRSRPARCNRAFFTSSGTEANEAAILLARNGYRLLRRGGPQARVFRRIVADQERDRTVALAPNPGSSAWHRACHQSILLPLSARLEVSRLRGRVRQGRRNLNPDGHKRPDRRVHRRNQSREWADSSHRRLNTSDVFKAVKKYGGLFYLG